jgi:polygalacturonase
MIALGKDSGMYDIRDYGAAEAGDVPCTEAIQCAIDDCAGSGGGKVYVPAGCYLTGTLFLRSGCELYLEQGAELRGSTRIADYKRLPDSLYWYNFFRYGIYGLIIADGISDAGISGKGIINGQGNSGQYFPNPDDPEGVRPFLIVYRDSLNMYLENIKIKEPSVFSFYGIHCDNIRICGVEIRSFGCTNGDGLDFDGSRNVRISDCILETGDDSISLKTLDPAYPCENFVISNCIMRSRWAAVRIGPESSADMRNCCVTNCVFQDCEDGLKIQTNSGGIFEDFSFSNITMRDVRRPVLMTQNYFRMGSKDSGIRPTSGIIRRVHIDGITAHMPHKNPMREAYMVLTGMTDKSIQDVSLNNLKIVFTFST